MPDSARTTKPFHYRELLAPIGALMKRVSRVRERHAIRVRDLVVSPMSRAVTIAGMDVGLSAKRFQLLATLAPIRSV